MFEFIKRKKAARRDAFAVVNNLYLESSVLESKCTNMLEMRTKIKVIKERSEEIFSKEYNSFMKSLNITNGWILGHVRNIKEEKIRYDGNELILVIHYTEIELKENFTEDEFNKILSKYNERHILFEKEEREFDSKFITPFWTLHIRGTYD